MLSARLNFPATLSLALILGAAAVVRAEPLIIRGSSTVAQALAPAVPAAKQQLGLEVKIGSEGGSQGGFLAVAADVAQLAMSTRHLEAADRAAFPEHNFVETQIGWQALAVAVAGDVWDGGVKSLTKEQLVSIYQLETRNWQKVGGPDLPIKFFCPQTGKGTWDLFVSWLYGDVRKAPLGKEFETVPTWKDARDSVEFNSGSFGVIPPQMTNQTSVFTVGLIDAEGTTRKPDIETLRAEKYPLGRPLLLISNRKLLGSSKRFVEFVLSPAGQALLEPAGFLPLEPTPAKAPPATFSP